MAAETHGIHMPLDDVAFKAREIVHTPEALRNLAELNRQFPHPEPRTASVRFLRELGCPDKFIPLVQQLNTPREIQEYINVHFTYNQSDTTKSIRGILETGSNHAHCFEGAFFGLGLLEVHGWRPPGVVVLQAGDNKYGEDHNFVPFLSGERLGSIAMSAWDSLKGKPPVYPSLRDLVLGGYYFPFTSEMDEYRGVWNLVGYSDIIDVVAKFGMGWMFREGKHALDDIYHNYAKNLMCTHLFNYKRYRYIDEKPGARVASGEERTR